MTDGNLSETARPRQHSAPSEDAVLFLFRKNAQEQVIARLVTFKGTIYADLRVHVEGADGKAHPTKKGLTLSLDCLADLEAAVRALRRAVEERGRAA